MRSGAGSTFTFTLPLSDGDRFLGEVWVIERGIDSCVR